jgi:hypothetical protein
MPRLFSKILDRLDETRAHQLRRDLGSRRWLVSWSPEPGTVPSVWLARVSCPQLSLTIERRGRTRVKAAIRAQTALERLLQGREARMPVR